MSVYLWIHIHIQRGREDSHMKVQIGSFSKIGLYSLARPIPSSSPKAVLLQVPHRLPPLSPLLTEPPFQSFASLSLGPSKLVPAHVLWAGQCLCPWTGIVASTLMELKLNPRRRELNWSWGFSSAIHLPQGYRSTRETDPIGPSLELWQADSMAIFNPMHSPDSSRKATTHTQTQGVLGERPSSAREDTAVARSPFIPPPPLTSQFPSSEPCRGCDILLVPVRSLTVPEVPVCHMNQQSWKFIWGLGFLSPSLQDLCETWSQSTLLSGCVLPMCEMKLLCSKENWLKKNFFLVKVVIFICTPEPSTYMCVGQMFFTKSCSFP